MISHKIKNIALLVMAVIILILGSVVGVQINLRKNDRIANELAEARNQTEIAKHQALAKSHKDRGDKLEAELVAERDSFKVAQKPLYEENQTLKKTIERLRPLVSDKIAADPNLRDFSGAQDSAILKQSEIITSLEQANMNEISKNEEIRNENREEVNELVLMTNGLQESLVHEQGESRKYKKQADKRFNLGVGAGYGVTSTGGDIRTGPVINLSIYYRLLRF